MPSGVVAVPKPRHIAPWKAEAGRAENAATPSSAMASRRVRRMWLHLPVRNAEGAFGVDGEDEVEERTREVVVVDARGEAVALHARDRAAGERERVVGRHLEGVRPVDLGGAERGVVDE